MGKRLIRALVLLAALLLILAGSGCMESDAMREARENVELGDAAYKAGDLPKAVQAYRQATARAPGYLPARVKLARSLVAAGEYLEARKVLDFVQEQEPDSVEALEIWARALALQGRFQESEGYYSRAVSAFDDPPAALLAEYAILLSAQQRYGEALRIFERAGLSDETNKADIQLHWGVALERAERFDEARERYEQALRIAPDHPILLNNLGFLIFRREMDREQGLSLMQRAVASDPGNAVLLHNLGWSLLSAERFEEAHDILARAVFVTDPSDPVFEIRQGHLEEAKEKLQRGTAGPEMPNLVLVVVDTLRPDHLGAYGYGRPSSPHIDALASQGVVFDQAISQAPWTGASLASLLTGLFPSVHGLDVAADWASAPVSAQGTVPFRVQKALTSSLVTLAELLRRGGYTTAGFVSSLDVSSVFGMGQGFDVYDAAFQRSGSAARRAGRPAAETNRQVLRWLDQPPVEPFLLFVHYDDPRAPYAPPAGFADDFTAGYEGALTPGDTASIVERQGRPITNLSEADLDYVVGLYDGEIRYVDAQLGRLLTRLDQLTLERDLLLVLTSDHGEEFLDHGSASHGYTLYDEQLRVPLVMRWPGRLPARRIAQQVRSIDVLPTLVELTGIDSGELALQGESLVALIEGNGESAPKYAYAEAAHGGDQRAVRAASGYKLIQHTSSKATQLFNLRSDPGEQRPLEAGVEATHADLTRALEEWQQRNTALAHTLEP